MSSLRSVLHDLCNALSIAQGMTEAVKDSLEGKLDLAEEKKISKLSKAMHSLERVEEMAQLIRAELIKQEEESVGLERKNSSHR
ncbi:MAG: hypothetical protein AB7I27_07135 [Bacteriovoracaceae bacterium]